MIPSARGVSSVVRVVLATASSSYGEQRGKVKKGEGREKLFAVVVIHFLGRE